MAAHQHSTWGKLDGAIIMSLAAKKIRFRSLSGSGKAGFATQAREKVKNTDHIIIVIKFSSMFKVVRLKQSFGLFLFADTMDKHGVGEQMSR